MGPVVSAIQLVAYLAGPAFAGTVTGFVVRTALTIGASMLFRALAPKPKIGSFGSGAASGVEQQRQLGEASPRAIALGWTIVAGSECALWASGDSDDNRFNTRVIAISDWPTTLQKIWVRGREITFEGDINTGWFACNQYRSKTGAARLWMRFVRGDWNQAADAQLISYANANGSWTSDDRLRGVSALLIRREYDVDAFQSGAPDNDDLRVEVKDAPVYDWRDVTQSLTDVTTWKPSDNAVVLVENALCLLRAPSQFSPGSTDPIVGPGLDFSRRPLAKLTAMANICDELVSGQPRYRAGGVVNAAMTGREIIDRFAAACAGSWVSSGDGGYLRPGHVPAPVMEIPSGALKANASDRYDPWSRPDDVVNTVVGSYPDPAQAWQITPLPPATDASWVATDGGVRTAQEDLSFCPYRDQAWRISVRKARGFRLMGARDFTGPHWLIELEPGDVVTAPDPALPYLASRWWMVQRAVLLAKQEGLTVQLTLNEIDSAIDAAPPALGAAAPFTPSSLSRALAVPPVTVGQRVVSGGAGGQYPELTFLIPDIASQGSGVVQLQGPATASENTLLAAAQIRNISLSRGLIHGEPVVAGWYRWRAAGCDVDGSVGVFATLWQDPVQVTAPLVADDSARLGGVLAADVVSGIGGAVSDNVFSRSEKRDFVPALQDLLGSAPELSAEALAMGIGTERTDFNSAITALTNLLAGLTTPVLWSNQSANTNISNPTAFTAAVSDAMTRRNELIAAMSKAASQSAVVDPATGAITTPNRTPGVVVANNRIKRDDGEIALVDALAAVAKTNADAAALVASQANGIALDGRTKADELISGVRTAFRAGLLGAISEASLNSQLTVLTNEKASTTTTNAIALRVTNVESLNATQESAIITLTNGLATKAEASTLSTLQTSFNNAETTNLNFRTSQSSLNAGYTQTSDQLTAANNTIGGATLSGSLTLINNVRFSEDQLLSVRITNLTSTVNSNQSSVTNALATQSNSIAANAAALSVLSAQVSAFSSGNDQINSELTDLSGYTVTFATTSFLWGRNVTPDWGTEANPAIWGHLTGAVSPGNCLDISGPRLPAVPGTRYGFSALLAPHNCQSHVRLDWLDFNGTVIGNSTTISGGTQGGGQQGNPATYTNVGGFDVAPANAVFRRVVTRLEADGRPSPYLFTKRWMTYPQPSGSTLLPYRAGPATNDNATLIANVANNSNAIASLQNSQATQSNVLTANGITSGTNIGAQVSNVGNAVATLQSASATYQTRVSATGSDPAIVELFAGVGGSRVGIAAAVIGLMNIVNGQFVSVMKAINGYAFFTNPISVSVGNFRATFGPNANLIIWYGPASIDPPNQTASNAVFSLGADGQIRVGGSVLQTGSMQMELSSWSVSLQRSGAGNTSTVVTATAFAPGTISYEWTLISGDAVNMGATNQASLSVGHSLAIGQDKTSVLKCVATSSVGVSAERLFTISSSEIS
jgi:hypothetical protein